MRICVVHRYPLSLAVGTNPALPHLLRALRERADEVVFLSFRDPDDSSGAEPAVTMEALPLAFDRSKQRDRLGKSLLFLLLAPLGVWRLHRRRRFDAVYCDDSFPLYGALVKLACRCTTIIRLGDLQTAYAFAGEDGGESFRFRAVFAIERLTWRVVDRLVVISDAFARYLSAHGLDVRRVGVVRECLDPSQFDTYEGGGGLRVRLGWGDCPVVMFHGVMASMKGLDTLVRAAVRVLEARPEVRFALIGDGPERARAEALAGELGVAQALQFVGWVPLSDIPGYLAECDVGVPSRSPNLGNQFVVTTALLQYWAMRKAVVAPSTAAVREVLEPGRQGLLFTPGDPDALSGAILAALADESLRRRMGEAGRLQAEALFRAPDIGAQMAGEVMACVTSRWL